MKFLRFVAVFYACVSTISLLAQDSPKRDAAIVGKVLDNNGRPVVSAKVSLTGTITENAESDVDGAYNFKVSEGKYKISIDAAGFDIFEDSLFVQAAGTAYLTSVLEKTKEIIGGVSISAKKQYKPNTIAGSIQAKVLSVQMVEALSIEEMGKTTIKNTADALKRIPGATISEGKFANIRGMFDRYNAGYLNGAPLPSTESDRKAFSFDVIPSGLLDGIVVIKSATPDLIGDFGGGVIKINTKSIPEKEISTINIGFQYNSITTGQAVRSFDMESANYFGLIASSQQIPTLDPRMKTDFVQPEVNVAETKKFDNNWTIKPYSSPITPKFSYTYGKPFKIKKMDAGLMVSYNYALSQRFTKGVVDSRDFSDNRLIKHFDDSSLITSVQNGGIINFSVKVNKRNRLDFRNLYSLTYDANSTVRFGLADRDNQSYSEGYSNMVNMNRLLSSQINGTHATGKTGSLSWLVNLGATKRQVPDFRIAQYAIPDNDRSQRMLVYNQFFYAGTGRFFSKMLENTVSSSVDYAQNVKFFHLEHVFKAGAFYQNRTRDFDSRQFAFGPLTVVDPVYTQDLPEKNLGADNISVDGTYLIEKTRNDKDDYTAFSRNYAAYSMLETRVPVFKAAGKQYDLRLIYGLRVEYFKQQLKNRYLTAINKIMANPAANMDFLPSINVIMPLTPKSNFRMAAYNTVNRPELRELAPFTFYNFNINSEIRGWDSLNRAQLRNAEVRYEWFANKQDLVSIGFFYKKITNPIEFRLDPTQALIRTFTYQNEKVATNYGIELELRKNLGSFIRVFGASWLKYFTLYANGSLISSAIKFGDGGSRPLQGQSPYVVNASLFYQNNKGFQVNANFNKIGPRIAYIGLPSNLQPFGADIYEFGRSMLDLQLGKSFGKKENSVIKVTFGDILAQTSVFYQDLDQNPKTPNKMGNGKYDKQEYNEVTKKGDNTLFSYTNGRTISVSYSYTF